MHDDARLIGSGARMQAIREFVRLVGSDVRPAAILGEPGSGRHFVANLLQAPDLPARPILIGAPDDPVPEGFLRVLLPPLRDRLEDIAALTDRFLGSASQGRAPETVSPSARLSLESYDWPGNVGELKEACEWIARTCRCRVVRRGCLPARLHRPVARVPKDEPLRGLDDQLQDLEKRLILKALVQTGHNRSQAARLLGIKRSTLGDRIQRLRLSERLGEEVA